MLIFYKLLAFIIVTTLNIGHSQSSHVHKRPSKWKPAVERIDVMSIEHYINIKDEYTRSNPHINMKFIPSKIRDTDDFGDVNEFEVADAMPDKVIVKAYTNEGGTLQHEDINEFDRNQYQEEVADAMPDKVIVKAYTNEGGTLQHEDINEFDRNQYQEEVADATPDEVIVKAYTNEGGTLQHEDINEFDRNQYQEEVADTTPDEVIVKAYTNEADTLQHEDTINDDIDDPNLKAEVNMSHDHIIDEETNEPAGKPFGIESIIEFIDDHTSARTQKFIVKLFVTVTCGALVGVLIVVYKSLDDE
jgi:predicted dinucleotide-binding enzyme